MRSPLQGLVCVLIAAACSTEKPAESATSTTVSRDDVTVTEPRDATPAATPAEEPTEADIDTKPRPQPLAMLAPATVGEEPKRVAETLRND